MKKLRYLVIGVLLCFMLFISGCNNLNNIESIKGNLHTDFMSEKIDYENIQSINEFFNDTNVKAYRKINKNTIDCLSGNCPKEDKPDNYFIDVDCFFCDNAKVYDNYIEASTSAMNWGDFMTTCSESHDFKYPQKFIIINKTNTKIVAKGTGFGHGEKEGKGCDNTYKFNITTNETWIFTTENISGTIDVKQEGPLTSKAIVYGKNTVEEYSKNGLIVECHSDYFQVKPWINLIQYNEYNATKHQDLFRIHKETSNYYENPERFTFSSVYGGKFVLQPVCKIIGKNSNTIKVIKSPKTYELKVTNSESKLDKRWADANLDLLDN